MDFLTTAVAFIVVLGVIIFVHELGHLLVAKLFNVRVETFSLGFGPRLGGFRRGETDYRVSAVPLGGYVKLGGELPGEGTGDPRGRGRTPVGKVVEPLAPAANPDRLTDRREVEKWFKRNCTQVMGRECTAEEKGHFLTYLLEP